MRRDIVQRPIRHLQTLDHPEFFGITRLKLKPGQKGTKALVAKYGDDLVCVRYRYVDATNTRIKTVELIVEKKTLSASSKANADNALVPVKSDLQRQH